VVGVAVEGLAQAGDGLEAVARDVLVDEVGVDAGQPLGGLEVQGGDAETAVAVRLVVDERGHDDVVAGGAVQVEDREDQALDVGQEVVEQLAVAALDGHAGERVGRHVAVVVEVVVGRERLGGGDVVGEVRLLRGRRLLDGNGGATDAAAGVGRRARGAAWKAVDVGLLLHEAIVVVWRRLGGSKVLVVAVVVVGRVVELLVVDGVVVQAVEAVVAFVVGVLRVDRDGPMARERLGESVGCGQRVGQAGRRVDAVGRRR